MYLDLKCPICKKKIKVLQSTEKCPECNGNILVIQDLSEDEPLYYPISTEPPMPLFEMNEGDLID